MKKTQQKGTTLFDKLISAESKVLAKNKTIESPVKQQIARPQTAPPQKAANGKSNRPNSLSHFLAWQIKRKKKNPWNALVYILQAPSNPNHQRGTTPVPSSTLSHP